MGWIRISLHRAHPIVDGTSFRREVGTYFIHGSCISFVGTCIALIFNLLQSLLSRSVQFEFEDVHEVGCFDNAVHPSFALLLFDVNGVDAHQTQQKVEGVLEIPFAFRLVFFAAHGVGNACQKARQLFVEGV